MQIFIVGFFILCICFVLFLCRCCVGKSLNRSRNEIRLPSYWWETAFKLFVNNFVRMFCRTYFSTLSFICFSFPRFSLYELFFCQLAVVYWMRISCVEKFLPLVVMERQFLMKMFIKLFISFCCQLLIHCYFASYCFKLISIINQRFIMLVRVVRLESFPDVFRLCFIIQRIARFEFTSWMIFQTVQRWRTLRLSMQEVGCRFTRSWRSFLRFYLCTIKKKATRKSPCRHRHWARMLYVL